MGFMAGLGAGFSKLPAIQMQNQELAIRKQANERAWQLEQQKLTGDMLQQFNDAIQNTPDDQVANRTNLFFRQIEQATGKKVDPAVARAFAADPQSAAKSMVDLYTQQPYDTKTLGNVLGNVQAFSGVYDALNKRRAQKETTDSFSQGVGATPAIPAPNPGEGAYSPQALGGQAPAQTRRVQPGVTDLSGMQDRLQQINDAIGKVGGNPNLAGFKERLGALQAQADAIHKSMEFAISNATTASAMRHGISDISQASPQQLQMIQQDVTNQLGLAKSSETAGTYGATPIPLEAAAAIQKPFGTTYGDLRGGSAPAQGATAPVPSAGGVNPNNVGNLRPVGATQGFQQFSSPDEGFNALVGDLKAKGSQGLNTIASIITKYAPPNENNTAAYIADTSRRLGVKPTDQLDMSNPVVLNAMASAIALHEKGPQAFLAKPAAVPQAGPATPAQTNIPPSAAQSAQDKLMAEDLGKQYLTWQQNGALAIEKQQRMEQLQSYLNKVNTGALAGSTLQIQRIAKAVGFNIPDSANYAEASASLAKQMAMELRNPANGGGLPGSMSNYEDKLLQSMVPNIDKLPGAAKLMSDAYIANQQRVQDIAALMRDYKKANGKVDEGIYNIIDQYKRDHPLFDAQQTQQINSALSGNAGGGRGKQGTTQTRPPISSFFK